MNFLKNTTLLLQTLIYGVFPVVGIVFFGWDWRQVILLYWLENITIGVQTFIALARTSVPLRVPSGPDTSQAEGSQPVGFSLRGIFVAIFFAFHYGMFTLVHGIFVFSLINGAWFAGDATVSTSPLWPVVVTWLIVSVVQVVLLTRRRPVDTGVHTIGGGLYALQRHMRAPYGRIVTLHVSIILGAFLIMSLQLPSAAALVLIAMRGVVGLVSLRKGTHTESIIAKSEVNDYERLTQNNENR